MEEHCSRPGDIILLVGGSTSIKAEKHKKDELKETNIGPKDFKNGSF